MKKGLLFLMLSVLSLGAWAQTSPYTGVAVGDIVSGNDYYLYNVESGLWLQNNDRTTNDWHTRGQLGTRGIDFRLNADGGGYKINGKFGKGSINHENLYLDANDNDVWVFESVSVGSVSNAVTISCSGTVLGARNYLRTYKAKNLFTEETESNYYLENQASESTKNNTWQIVTKEERLAKMGSATNQSPKDASWLIKSPDFANNDSRYSNWTRTGNWARGGDANGDWGRGSMIMESWNSGSSVKISQTIADIPNGVYTLQLQGYYRDGMAGDNTDFNDRGCTNETCIEAKHNAGTEVIRAKYYANESEANLRSIIDETHTTAKTGPDCWNFTRLGNYYFPNDMQTAQRAMNIEKAYVNEPITVVVTDGKLEIGVEKTGSVAYDWVIIDNFKLTYYGFEEWNGTDDAILPSIKYGGSYGACTKLYNADYDYGDGQTNNAHFNQIVGTPVEDESSNAWYAENYVMKDWTYGISALPNFGNGKPADIYVRRYFTVNNDLPSTVYMPTPHDDAPCEYYINGTLVWSRTGTEQSVDGWYEDEVVRLTNEQKDLIHTDGTVNVFAFHVHQNWGGRYADGGLYGDANTDGTPSKKFRDDTNRSRLETVFNTFSVSDFTTWYGISSETANKAKAACDYRQDASYYFDQLFPAALTYRIGKAIELKDLGKMSTAGASTLNTAISTATTAKNAGNKDNYVSALTALNTAFNAAVIDLKQEQAEKSIQPTIFTMVSESVVGMDDNNYGTVVTNHDDGFYIYNVGTGRWFCGGDDWGAHAAVGFPGIKVTTPENNYVNGHYNSVVTWLFNGNWGSGGQLNHDGYCDTGGNGWKFWQQDASQGIFTWARNGDNTGNNTGLGCGTQGLVGFAPSTFSRVNTNRTGADDPYNQWIFVTEAQRDEMAEAAMATASETNPVDLTYKIKMPGFNQRERKEGENQSSDVLDWTCNHANYRYNGTQNPDRLLIMGRGDNHADFVCDVYGNDWKDAFSMTQTVTGLQPGRYRVKVQGYNKGGGAANKAYLEANGQKATLVEHSSESVLPWTYRLPENTFDNPEYFQAGCYWNEVICTVGSDGELTLGVKSQNVASGHVIIFDNFRLEYVGLVGATVSDADYTTFVAPYNIGTIPSGVEAYACQVRTNYVHLEPVTAIPEGEAVVLKNEGTYKFSPASGSVSLGTANDLQASDGNVTGAAGNIYALAKKGEPATVGFYRVGDDVIVPAGKGYLQVSNAVKAFYGFDDDDATSINEELSVKSEESGVVIYNVAGQRLNKMQRGINILNRRKVLF